MEGGERVLIAVAGELRGWFTFFAIVECHLGDAGLDAFAGTRGTTTWKDFPDKMNWKPSVVEKLADPSTQVRFNLDQVNVWDGISPSSAGCGDAIDWDFLQIGQNPRWRPTIKFLDNEIEVQNPFNQGNETCVILLKSAVSNCGNIVLATDLC